MSDHTLSRESVQQFADAHRGDYESWLAELVSVPTVSADPAHSADVRRGAEIACQRLRSAGADAQVIQTRGNPLIFGRFAGEPGFPTVTVYNHMDVQPADAGDWRTPPFDLHIEGDRYYGRGATDDKGPALAALLGAMAARQAGARLTINFLWELEEEIGSASFADALAERRDLFVTDSVVVSDTVWVTRGRPSSPAGLRGLQPFELFLETATNDLHSGITGGAVRNPLAELMQVVATCVDARTGEVLIPGFYDEVEPLADADAAGFLASGFAVETFQRDHQLKSLRSNDPLDVMRRLWALPTFEVHGLVGGYTGPGVKAAIAPRAQLKASCRLVPNMTCAGTLERIRSFLAARFPDVQLHAEPGLEPFKGHTSGPLADAIRAAYRFGFGVDAVFTREGGSIGAVPTMEEVLQAPVVFLGLSLPEHGYHGQNEFFDWPQVSGGIAAFAHYFLTLAREPA